MTTTEKTMHIVRMEAENVKRLTAVGIEPDGNVIAIKGNNGAGKTSVLDSIEMALAGKSSIPAAPVRQGETRARIVLDLGDITVQRRWKPSGASELLVANADGEIQKSPQALLDALWDKLAADPVAFMRLRPADQRDRLLQIAGADIAALDDERKKVYEQRTYVGRQVKDTQTKLGEPITDAPATKPDATALNERLEELDRQASARAQKEHELAMARHRVDVVSEDIEQLKRELAARREQLDTEMEAVEKTAAELDAMPDEDLSEQIRATREELATVNVVLERWMAAERRAETKREVDRLQGQYDELSAEIADIDGQKNAELRRALANIPVGELDVDDEGVTYKGVPLSQASHAEQLRVSVALALAANPSVRVLLVRDGSLLDPNSFALLAELAAGNNAQVWVETVGADGPAGVLIEDGTVASADGGNKAWGKEGMGPS